MSNTIEPDATPAAAHRIAEAHNRAVGNLSGGKLVFDTAGNGGEWYNRDALIPAGNVVVRVGHSPITPAVAERRLQEHAERRAIEAQVRADMAERDRADAEWAAQMLRENEHRADSRKEQNR